MKNEEGVNCGNMDSLFPSCARLDCGYMDSLHLNHWPKCCRQALGSLYNFSGTLLFFTAFIASEFGDGA